MPNAIHGTLRVDILRRGEVVACRTFYVGHPPAHRLRRRAMRAYAIRAEAAFSSLTLVLPRPSFIHGYDPASHSPYKISSGRLDATCSLIVPFLRYYDPLPLATSTNGLYPRF